MNFGTFRSPGGESNHNLPYNNGVSLHVGPVRVLGDSAEAEIEPICVLCVGAIDCTAAGCCQIHAHSLVSVDRLPSRARAASIDSLPARGRGRSRRASAAPAAKRDTREGFS